jgi:hypothetical protein
MLKDEIESNKLIMEKIKNLSKEKLEKVGINMDELDSDQEEDDSMNCDDEKLNEAIISDNELKLLELKKRYQEIELLGQQTLQEFCELGGDMDELNSTGGKLVNNEINAKIEPPKKESSKTMFKYIVKIKDNDYISFIDPELFESEIIKHKGNVNIEHAFFNRHNKLFYLCTNDEGVYQTLLEEWPANAFTMELRLFSKKK